MSVTMRYDEEPARRIQALSETDDMRAQRRRVIELLAPRPGWRVLEVGCGPGHLAEAGQGRRARRPGVRGGRERAHARAGHERRRGVRARERHSGAVR